MKDIAKQMNVYKLRSHRSFHPSFVRSFSVFDSLSIHPLFVVWLIISIHQSVRPFYLSFYCSLSLYLSFFHSIYLFFSWKPKTPSPGSFGPLPNTPLPNLWDWIWVGSEVEVSGEAKHFLSSSLVFVFRPGYLCGQNPWCAEQQTERTVADRDKFSQAHRDVHRQSGPVT